MGIERATISCRDQRLYQWLLEQVICSSPLSDSLEDRSIALERGDGFVLQMETGLGYLRFGHKSVPDWKWCWSENIGAEEMVSLAKLFERGLVAEIISFAGWIGRGCYGGDSKSPSD